MGKLLTPYQMEMQAAAFKNFLDGGGEWALRGDEATFSPTYRNDGLPVTVKGVNNVDNFALAGKSITIPADSYDTDTQITVTGEGYNFTSNDIINVAVAKGTVEIFNAPSTVKVDGENTCVENISASDVILFGETCAGSSLRYADDVIDITATVDNIFVGGGASNNSVKVLPHEGAVTEGVTVSGGAGVDSVDLSQNTVLSEEETLRGAHVIENNNSCISIKGFTENDTIQIAGAVDLDYIKGNSSIIGANYLDIHNTLYFVGLSAASNISLPGMSGGTAIHLMDKSGNVIYPEFCVPKAITFTDDNEIVTLNSELSGYTVDMRGGNDTVVIDDAEDISLNTGAGVDSVSISSGAGECTIYSGKGQDTIHNSASNVKHIYQITGNDADKMIFGFTRHDYLQIMDDSAFVPTVFNPQEADCFPVTVGNAQVSVQGALTRVSCVNILDKNGNLIGSNNSSGVVFKTPDISVSGAVTVDGCNCLVTDTGSASRIYNESDGVTIFVSNTGHKNSVIENVSDGYAGNDYVFRQNLAATFNDTLKGFCPEKDNIYMQGYGRWQDIVSQAATFTVNADDFDVCNDMKGGWILSGYRTYGYLRIVTLKPFYGTAITINVRRDSNDTFPLTGFTALTCPVVHACAAAKLITNDRLKTLTYTGGVGVIQKFADGTLNSNAPVTVAPEAAGSAVTMAGGIVQADSCTVRSAQNATVAGNNNILTCTAANVTVTTAQNTSDNVIYAQNNGDCVICNGTNETIWANDVAADGKSTTVQGFDANTSTIGVNARWQDAVIQKVEAVEGGAKITISGYRCYTYITLLGIRGGRTLKIGHSNRAAKDFSF